MLWQEGVKEAEKDRKNVFPGLMEYPWQEHGLVVQETAPADAISVIGGADGPTSIFVAGKVGSLGK